MGPELTSSVQEIYKAFSVPVKFETVLHTGGLEKIKDSICKNKIALIGTIGYVDVNPTYSNILLRKQLDLYANVVHAKNRPGIKSRHQNIDIYLMREQTEGEYSTIEHEMVKGVVECLKITTEKKSKRIAKFAFDFALQHNRKRVTAIHKANIIKMGDGLFLKCCREVSKLYPKIQFSDLIVDNATMQLTSNPSQFDILVMQNLYGSIIDNICSGITGGAGVTPGASYSADVAVFQPGARHTFADAKGKNIANPLAMILCSACLLEHINLKSYAARIRQAIHTVMTEKNISTTDLGGSATTKQFTEEIIKCC